MAHFIEISLRYPTIFFSFFLSVCLLLSIITILGLFSSESIEADISSDASASQSNDLSSLTSVMYKLKFHDVPLTLSFTLWMFFSWFFSYFIDFFVSIYLLGSGFYLLFATLQLVIVLWLGVYPTRLGCKLIRPLFQAENKVLQKNTLIGRKVKVTSSKVTSDMGEAMFDDTCAGLLLHVISEPGVIFFEGEEIVLLSYDVVSDKFLCVSEAVFQGHDKFYQ